MSESPPPYGAAGDPVARLEELRGHEKEQALLYRSLAARAEEEQVELAERFHDLHADEQHHLSRLTARILELGGRPVDLTAVRVEAPDLSGWESVIGTREAAEIARYREAIGSGFDSVTTTLLEEILEVELHHAAELGFGGKWTMA